MDVYIKPKQKAKISERKIIYIKDVAEVFSRDKSMEAIKNTPVLVIKDETRKNYALSVMDIIRCITEKFPDLTVNNVGEKDVLVEFCPKKEKENKVFKFIKIAAVSIVLFLGSATTIMSFQADGELLKIMEGYYHMFYGTTKHSPLVLEIPYCIGIAFGITVFFNHFSRSKESKDPTPIEIQMTLYDKQTVESMVDSIDEKGK